MSIERETSRFGLLTVSDEDILTFPKGIPGFETHRQWALAGDDDSPIKWLQSLADGDVALPVADPGPFGRTTTPEFPKGTSPS
ncbi:hypothetical protein MASR1M66_22670 [Aminivibrio sp.]